MGLHLKYPNIGVMCASSDHCDEKYFNLARNLGNLLAKNQHRIIYGGGNKGLMKAVADSALAIGGAVDGYMPDFMAKVEWQHKGLTNLFITKNMSERKEKMMTASDAQIFLPGGCGTMEEFFDILTAKRLGLYFGPLIIINYHGFYNPLIELLNSMVKEKFLNKVHEEMWSVANNETELLKVLEDAPEWSKNAIEFASVKKTD